MKPLFYGLTIAACIAACVFSVQLKGKFEGQQQTKNDAIALHKKKTKESEEMLAKLNKEKDTLKGAQDQQATLEASISALQAQAAQLAKDIRNLDGKLDEQKATFAELDRAKTKIQELLGPVTLEELPDKVKEVNTSRDTLQKELEELTATVDGAKKNVASNQEEIARMGENEARRAARFKHNSMESVVTAVNEEWGFIVIGAGSNTGFTPQTKLLVQRGGKLVGEVKPSAIEPSQTIAEIDEDTIAPGARIQPGDRVILAEPATN